MCYKVDALIYNWTPRVVLDYIEHRPFVLDERRLQSGSDIELLNDEL